MASSEMMQRQMMFGRPENQLQIDGRIIIPEHKSSISKHLVTDVERDDTGQPIIVGYDKENKPIYIAKNEVKVDHLPIRELHTSDIPTAFLSQNDEFDCKDLKFLCRSLHMTMSETGIDLRPSIDFFDDLAGFTADISKGRGGLASQLIREQRIFTRSEENSTLKQTALEEEKKKGMFGL